MTAPVAIEVSGACKQFGSVEVLRDVSLRVEPASVVALLGPSGCGKTTLLRTIAGLERLNSGQVKIGDRLVAGGSTHVPPERRRVGMVFQDWALFPHLTVGQNVGYGLPRGERSGRRVDQALEMVGLEGLGDRSPSTLSGGQQQRVALARALAPQPGVLLLDEPFSNLDSALRVQVRTEVHQLLAELEVTTVFVTHDQEEAFVLGHEVAVMSAGQVVQQATPTELYTHPATPWIARFVGDANLVPATAQAGVARTAVGDVALEEALAGSVQVVMRPEDLAVRVPDAGVDGQPAWVELVEYYGHDTVYVMRPKTFDGTEDGGLLRARVASAPRFQRGDEVLVSYVGRPAVAYPAHAAADINASGAVPSGDEDVQATTGGADVAVAAQLPTT